MSRIRTYARDDDLPLIDFYGTWFDGEGALRTELFLEDGLHANKIGHRQMADTATALLQEHFRLRG